MSDAERFDRLVKLKQRGLVTVFDGEPKASVHTTPTIFFDRDRDAEPDEDAIPGRMLDERQHRLNRGYGTREWYLITAEPLPAEWAEELRGDYGVLIVEVDDMDAAREALK